MFYNFFSFKNNPKAKFARESPVNIPTINGTTNKKYNSDDDNLDQLLEMIDDVHKSDPSYNNSYNFPKKSNISSQPPSQIFYPSSEKSLKSHSESFYFDHKPKHIHSDDAHLGLSNSWDEFENNFVVNNKMSQGYSHSHQPSKDYSSSTNDNSNNSSKQRCSRVVLGGSEASRGARVSAFSKVVCDNLLCSSCNFKVLSFFNKEWSSSTDYLFLRNNMPNVNKLSMNLIDRRGSVAYCCQCSQASVQDERVLIYGSTTDPKWICSGHNC